MHRKAWIAAAVLMAMGLALAHTERNEQQAEAEHYCDMVEIYNDSQGRYGWPNYENRECN